MSSTVALYIGFRLRQVFTFFFFNDTATTEIYTLSLHDALPIFPGTSSQPNCSSERSAGGQAAQALHARAADSLSQLRAFEKDRKSTRLNSSHSQISYAVFCLKKKKVTDVSHAHPSSPYCLHAIH